MILVTRLDQETFCQPSHRGMEHAENGLYSPQSELVTYFSVLRTATQGLFHECHCQSNTSHHIKKNIFTTALHARLDLDRWPCLTEGSRVRLTPVRTRWLAIPTRSHVFSKSSVPASCHWGDGFLPKNKSQKTRPHDSRGLHEAAWQDSLPGTDLGPFLKARA